jgi:hypothetical protein
MKHNPMSGLITILLLLFLLMNCCGCLDSPRDLNLSEISVLSDENTLIAVQDNITFLNYMSALRIQDAFPDAPIKQYSEITEQDRKSSNIVVMGNRDSNAMFEDVYNLSRTISENRTFQGEGNGSIEVISNPWNSQTSVLLVEGSDKWGVRAASKFIEAGETGNLSGNYTEVDYHFPDTSDRELEEVAIEKAEEIFADETQYDYDSTVSEKTLSPLFYEYFEGYEVYSARAELVEPGPIVPGFGDYFTVTMAVSPSGTSFILWGYFADMFEFEKPAIEDGNDAIEVVSLYASYTGRILVNVSEIPHESPSGENPANYQDIVKPPFSIMKNSTYSIDFFTWGNGKLTYRSFEIGFNSSINIKAERISNTVGDYHIFE